MVHPSGGSVINGATPSSFQSFTTFDKGYFELSSPADYRIQGKTKRDKCTEILVYNIGYDLAVILKHKLALIQTCSFTHKLALLHKNVLALLHKYKFDLKTNTRHAYCK